MGANIPARIQLGFIDHVLFPIVIPCLGASLALFDQALFHLRFRSKTSYCFPHH
ncbi:hypothetical protein MA16_Dca028302 [Dendrobium catenatum]|uniref:Uncharacterized protein n=1 Tax=Dendrobium catenatum TaxID=906689 RepID=A0A2I0V8T8_9ASPA|nr:hypothetical protein MA16_Dca028302 [Dendrobium catenatum]